MQMDNEWETPSRKTSNCLSGGGSSSSIASSPHSSHQHIPAYDYFDSADQQHYLHYPVASRNNPNNRKLSATNDVRNYRHRVMERAAYTNRSFMHHEQHQYVPHRAVGFTFESSHYGIDHSDRKYDRRRHSLHHIAQLSASKMDDLKHRFDEYSSSVAVGRGQHLGGGGGSRRPSRQSSGNQFTADGGRLNLGYSGSRSLDVYEPKPHRATRAEGGHKGSSAKTPKRGSRSSQGSTDSSHSSHSASSGSLLLTVANLENFAKIHKNHEPSYGTSKTMEEYLSSTTGVVPTAAILDAIGTKFNGNITFKQTDTSSSTDQTEIDYHKGDSNNLPTESAIISIEEIASDLQQQRQLQDQQSRTTKTKDPDSVSMASSTHFTMINGVGGPQRLPKGGICSRGHQITVLIVTMSIVFMVGICAAVFFLEMRAREMPR
ncbi:uncharacterized protein LOC131435868 isoform X2 [Malaya genurostris]|uniref:uncharacterized protein LOC131435868 isoform X2 n=1 Tax=Malaya genurostris TaxID=325434 RepID=UPI0026F403DC|nr:uncharacterized protein LOC131435868 isoform X2 [Malaya genurostris]XP_058460100.1 uncharacterized protein LOC131435868 isoform X2 [Malaya genurostris]